MNKLLPILSSSVFLAAGAFAAEHLTDLDTALAKAQKENKLVLVEFTGSDWCPPCKQLKKMVIGTPKFEKFLDENNLIFVELDYPRTPGKVSEEIKKLRENILTRFGVTGFPTLLFLDGNAAPYEMHVGSARTADEYMKKLTGTISLKKNFDLAVLTARAEKNPEQKIKALDAALKTLHENFRAAQKEVIAEIIANDPNDTLGYKKQVRDAELAITQREEIKALFAKHSGKLSAKEIEAARNDALEMLKNPELLLFAKGALYKYISDGYALQRDYKKALEYLEKARDLEPETARGKYLNRWCKQLEKVIAEEAARNAPSQNKEEK